MKILYCFFYAAVFSFLVQSAALSQISITSSDLSNMFAVGTSRFSYLSSDTMKMNVGTASSSSSQTWTAPAFTTTDTFRLDNVLASSTPYISYFPRATSVQFNQSYSYGLNVKFYLYYRETSDSLVSIGSAEHESGTVGSMAIDTTYIINSPSSYVPIPMQLGDVYSEVPDTVDEGGGVTDVLTSQSAIDAYGTLVLPEGSFESLRVSNVYTTNVYSGGNLTNIYRLYEITWYTKQGYDLSVEVDSSSMSGTVNVHAVTITYTGKTPATAVVSRPGQPATFSLGQNYPNPFNPTTVIRFGVRSSGFVSLKVYDMLGRLVKTLVDKNESPGNYEVTFNGSGLASGVYFYRLYAGSFSRTRKMLLLK